MSSKSEVQFYLANNQQVTNMGQSFPESGQMFFFLSLLLPQINFRTKKKMNRIFRNNIENISVGIFRDGKSYTAKILSSDCGRDAARHVSTKTIEHPVFIRSFSEMVLALGYCNIINQLSKKSVERIMQMADPGFNE